jgi:hypothetical protein
MKDTMRMIFKIFQKCFFFFFNIPSIVLPRDTPSIEIMVSVFQKDRYELEQRHDCQMGFSGLQHRINLESQALLSEKGF